MTTILAIGATSAMVFETLRLYASDRATIILAGRDKTKLQLLAQDLKVRGATDIHCLENELATKEAPLELFEEVKKLGVSVDLIYVGYGVLPLQEEVLIDATKRADLFQVNLISAMDHCCIWYQQFITENREGTIAVISSVAGDRGRGSNFLYGATKAGLDAFLSGLRNYGAKKGISVITIKPGFVESPMTAHIPKNALFTSAAKAGAIIYKAIKNKKDIVYVPWFWCFILLIIKLIPERIFKRLSL
jgi:decaprenylphospho-beta-D-erythro-pentofuranosid-2-ulose 2-reductase